MITYNQMMSNTFISLSFGVCRRTRGYVAISCFLLRQGLVCHFLFHAWGRVAKPLHFPHMASATNATMSFVCAPSCGPLLSSPWVVSQDVLGPHPSHTC